MGADTALAHQGQVQEGKGEDVGLPQKMGGLDLDIGGAKSTASPKAASPTETIEQRPTPLRTE